MFAQTLDGLAACVRADTDNDNPLWMQYSVIVGFRVNQLCWRDIACRLDFLSRSVPHVNQLIIPLNTL
jgi:hypothetical protein